MSSLRELRRCVFGDADRAQLDRFAEELVVSSDAERAEAARLFVVALCPELAERFVAEIDDAHVAREARELLDLELSAGVEAELGDTDSDEFEGLFERSPAPSHSLDIARFIDFFGGATHHYARQWYDRSRRRSGYRPARAPLTEELVAQHLEGVITLGQYLLWPDDTVSFAALDLDLSSDALEGLRLSPGASASALEHPRLREYAQRLISVAHAFGTPLFAEDSGNRGLHLWGFFEPRLSAKVARRWLAMIVRRAGSQPEEVSVELFPKQDRRGPRGWSSLIKLPLGVHQVTARRCPLLDDSLRVLRDDEGLARLSHVSPSAVGAVVSAAVVVLPAPELQSERTRDPDQDNPSNPSAGELSLGEALAAIPSGFEQRRATERVLEQCGRLRRLVDEAAKMRRLEPSEVRALVYTLGLIGPENPVCTEALEAARAPRAAWESARRGRPNPMGCRRLATIVPGIDCDCGATEGLSSYPTPVAAALSSSEAARAVRRCAPKPVELLNIRSPWEDVADRLGALEADVRALRQSGSREEVSDEPCGGPDD